ncbi:hypothetical protein CCP3SC5AM1_2310002 [Gammaproteobacteria bacterium]
MLDDANSAGHELRVERNIPDVLVPNSASGFESVIPVDTFVHTDQSATVTLSAVMVDGSPLPGWLNFNAETGTLKGKPPEGFQGELTVKIIARDDSGRQAETITRIINGTAAGQSFANESSRETVEKSDIHELEGQARLEGESRTTAGFAIPVMEKLDAAGGHELRLERNIPDQSFSNDTREIMYVVPADTFVHTDQNATVELVVTMVDGSSLPDWLHFDAKKGEFKGQPPEGFQGELLIKVVARDDAGRHAETIVRIRLVKKVDEISFNGKAGLTEQFKRGGVFAWQAERNRLVQQARLAGLKNGALKAA